MLDKVIIITILSSQSKALFGLFPLKKATKAFCNPALLPVDGWFHFLSSKGLGKSEVTSILLIEARICLYNLCMYVWSCSFADGYLQQLFRLLQG